MFRRDVRTMATRDEQVEFLEHTLDRARFTAIPRDDALRGIAPTDEMNLRSRIGAAKLARDVDEETALGDLDPVSAAGEAEHFEAVLKRGAVKFLVRIDTRHHAHGLVNDLERGVDQREMGTGHRIECAGEHPDPFPRHFSNVSRIAREF